MYFSAKSKDLMQYKEIMETANREIKANHVL